MRDNINNGFEDDFGYLSKAHEELKTKDFPTLTEQAQQHHRIKALLHAVTFEITNTGLAREKLVLGDTSPNGNVTCDPNATTVLVAPVENSIMKKLEKCESEDSILQARSHLYFVCSLNFSRSHH